jgi:hypothetical protein
VLCYSNSTKALKIIRTRLNTQLLNTEKESRVGGNEI